MAYTLKVLIFLALCALAVSAQDVNRRRIPTSPGRPTGGSLVWIGATHPVHGRPHNSQGGNQTSIEARNDNLGRNRRDVQGGPHESQGGAHASQGGSHENQGRVRRQVQQGGPHNSQGGAHSSQGGAHENQGRVRRQVQQGGPNESQGGAHTTQGGPHENQGRVKRQAPQSGPNESHGGAHISQRGPHENQGRVRRETEDTLDDETSLPTWISCDATVFPRISCHDCSTRMICKNVGGLLKSCTSRLKPYCNMGVCSSTPGTQCTSTT